MSLMYSFIALLLVNWTYHNSLNSMKTLTLDDVETLAPSAIILSGAILEAEKALKETKENFRKEYENTAAHAAKVAPMLVKRFNVIQLKRLALVLEYLGFTQSEASTGIWVAIANGTLRTDKKMELEVPNG